MTMPGRAQHPTDAMREHGHVMALRETVERLRSEISDRRRHLFAAQRELRRLELAEIAQRAFAKDEKEQKDGTHV